MKRLKLTTAAVTALLLTSACAMQQNEKPKYGSLARTLYLVDQSGTSFGSVEMDPVSGGRLFDAEGRLIGTVVTPAVTSTVTTTTPIPAAAVPTY